MNSRRSVIVLMIAALGISGCANSPLAPTPEVRKVRAVYMSFAQPHLEVEAGFLVSSNSKISSITEVDRDGVRVGVTQGSTT